MAAEKPVKKPYTAPKLRLHGDLRQLTRGGRARNKENNSATGSKRSKAGS